MARKLSHRKASNEDVSALYALVDCQMEKICELPESDMGAILTIAESTNPESANIHTVSANFYTNMVRNYNRARKEMLQAIKLSPQNPQYWENLIKLDIFTRRFDDARTEIAHLDGMNRLGALSEGLQRLKQRLLTAENRYQKPNGLGTVHLVPPQAGHAGHKTP